MQTCHRWVWSGSSSSHSCVAGLGPQVCLLSQVGCGSAGDSSPLWPCLLWAISNLTRALRSWQDHLLTYCPKLRSQESEYLGLGASNYPAPGLEEKGPWLRGDSRAAQTAGPRRRGARPAACGAACLLTCFSPDFPWLGFTLNKDIHFLVTFFLFLSGYFCPF